MKIFTLKQLLSLYNKKYKDGSEYLVVKSLTYFEDAENDTEHEIFKNVSWNKIKSLINQTVVDYLK